MKRARLGRFGRAWAGESDVFLTFDDGFTDVFNNALPILREHGFRSIQFLVANLLGKTSEWQASSGELPGVLMDKAQMDLDRGGTGNWISHVDASAPDASFGSASA